MALIDFTLSNAGQTILLVNGEPIRVERANNMESQKLCPCWPFSPYECQLALIGFTLSNATPYGGKG